jgi:dTMP kinase
MIKKRRGKLIVIDGADGSGKTTQWEMLKKRFRKEEISHVAVDFPIYRSFFGKFIKRYLVGDFGDPVKADPYFSSYAYALDRFFYKGKIEKALGKGRIVLANRYVAANKIHQGAKIKNTKERGKFLRWLDNLEYSKLKIPKPDLVIYLFVPAKISRRLLREREKKERKRRLDVFEKNLEYQRRVVAVSRKLCRKYRNWRMINCVEERKLLSKEVIHEKVWKLISA